MDGFGVVLPVLAGVLAVMVAVLLVWKMASVYWDNLEVLRLEKELTGSEFIVVGVQCFFLFFLKCFFFS